MLSIESYKRALVYYVAVMALLFSGFSTYVAAPHRQVVEVGQTGFINSSPFDIENRKFSDYTNSYIPEISEHLTAARSGWLPLWSNSTELGRPLYQISGFSSAYLLTWILGRFVHDPWRLITTLSLSFCFLAGLFILLFTREIGLSPIAGLIAGTSLATSPLFMYWLTFPMFPAVWCWGAGALWAVTRLAKRHDLLGWSVLAFTAYSLLMTAYPQPVVFHAYLLGGYGLWSSFHQLRINRITLFKFLMLAASALVAGAALAFPVYRDLVILWAESARVSPAPSFFTVVLPKFASFAELVRLFALGTVPEIFGNPIAPSFPFPYDGLSVTPIVIFFAVAGLLTAFRKTWGWWLAILVLCLLAFVHPLYVFGVNYLGFNLSRSTPLGSIMLPLTVIVAFGMDALAKYIHGEQAKIVFLSGVATLVVIGIGVAYGISQHAPIRWEPIVGMLLVSGLLIAQYDQHRPLLLMVAVASVLVMTSYPLMLKQDPEKIAMTSPLVEKVRENLPPGSRYAVAGPGISVLPPNLNATLGLASVHSYNSLSSTRYHTLIKALGGEVQIYGRWNGSISPDFSSPMFWMSNISLILSRGKLAHENLEALGEESGVHLYRVVTRMGESLQIASLPQLEMGSTKMVIDDPRLLKWSRPVKVVDEGDVLEFEVSPSPPSVFLLSQKFHRDWQARAYTKEGWRVATTVEINGVFQGVLLASETSRVRLEFKPLVRYAWIAHEFWFLLLILGGFRSWRSYRYRALGRYEKHE